jgi:hypothetical protein
MCNRWSNSLHNGVRHTGRHRLRHSYSPHSCICVNIGSHIICNHLHVGSRTISHLYISSCISISHLYISSCIRISSRLFIDSCIRISSRLYISSHRVSSYFITRIIIIIHGFSS